MIERVGTSSALSVLIVVSATLVLHRAERHSRVVSIPSPAGMARPFIPPAPRQVAAPKKAESAPVIVRKLPEPSANPKPARPDSAFTHVESGESLADVARRVYGPGVQVEEFWKVNRDQVPEIDATLKPGLLLRTPQL